MLKYTFTFTLAGKTLTEKFTGHNLRRARQGLFAKYGSRNVKIKSEQLVR